MRCLPQRVPLRFALRWVLAFVGNAALFPAAAQTKPGPGVDGLCESMEIRASLLERPPSKLHYPAWTLARFNPADNRQIAAVRVELDSGGFLRRHLYVLNLDTRRHRLLVRDVGCALSWGRTGWLVLERGGQLWKIRASGDGLTRLTARSTPSAWPVWSPSGQRLACVQATGSESPAQGIVLLTPDGQVASRLPLGKISVVGAPAWSPDGRKLAFVGVVGEAPNLYEYDLRTRQTREVFWVRKRLRDGYCLNWLKNGKGLVWRTADQELIAIDLASRDQRMFWNNGQILSVDLDATGRRVLLIAPEGQPFDPGNRNAGGYLVHSLFTANLNGSRRIEVK